VEVVTSFKLLGVTIDNKLNFRLHAANIRLIVNKKMFSIKKLFYLAFSVKLQFFKSFILPYFDYCLSLLIYFPKSTIQKLKNRYDFCLLKLFNIKISEYNLFKQKIEADSTDITNAFNTSLSEIVLAAFAHRFLRTATLFIHKIVNISTSPQLLAKQIVFKKDQKNNYSLRNSENVCIPPTKTLTGEESFSYFFSSLLNNVLLSSLNLNFIEYKKKLFQI